MEYLLSNRDGAVQESAMSRRVRRASTNFKESFPIFLALCLLSIIVEVNNTSLAMYWLIFRALYLISYAAGIIYLRTLLDNEGFNMEKYNDYRFPYIFQTDKHPNYPNNYPRSNYTNMKITKVKV